MTMPIDGRPFSVVGAGVSGVAAANVLAARGGDVRLVDGKQDKPRPAELHPDVAFEAGTNRVRPGDVAVLSPGVSEVSPVRAEVAAVAAEVIGEVELFYRLSPAPILAVTGTDGKSTVTTMLGAIARAAGRDTHVGGNLGNPLCTFLDDLTERSLVVAEISCFQLTTCETFRPRVAVVTNIAEDHINYHGSFAAYQAAKRRVWRRMTRDDVLVINGEDPLIGAWELPAAPAIRRFGLRSGEGIDAHLDGRELMVAGEPLMPRSELELLGSHNVANALAAALAAKEHGLPLEAARRGLATYRPLPHRLETVRVVEGVRWVNDSKATNPNAARAGILAMERPFIVLAGGSEKGTDFTDLGKLIGGRARAAILFGETRHQLADAINAGHAVVVVETLEQAVETAQRRARRGDTVLLCPACASFDQFRSFEHRGDVFKALVAAL